MVIKRYINNIPCSKKELSKTEFSNEFISQIIQNVKCRIEENESIISEENKEKSSW